MEQYTTENKIGLDCRCVNNLYVYPNKHQPVRKLQVEMLLRRTDGLISIFLKTRNKNYWEFVTLSLNFSSHTYSR